MGIVYKAGDLFAADERVLVHGCNARGAFDSGVAGQMRRRYPRTYQTYLLAFRTAGLHLGEVIWTQAEDGRLIGNAITQADYGSDRNRVYADYEAIRWAMQEVNLHVAGQYDRVGMPTIGAGLANGSWSVISRIIEDEATQFTPVVYLRDGVVPGS
jgi:O-acetyl-ADP-ribose deacetylase (regulator of RNase III)